MSMSIANIRDLLLNTVRGGGDSTRYSAVDLDRAVRTACDKFVMLTQCLNRSDDVTIAKGASTFTLPTGFRPDRLVSITLNNVSQYPHPLEHLAWDSFYAESLRQTTASPPRVFSFKDWNTIALAPAADIAYSAAVRWTPFFDINPGTNTATWTDGTVNPAVIGYPTNLPDDMLREILYTGANALLTYPVPEQAYASQAWALFDKYVQTIKGIGSLGQRISYRSPQGSVGIGVILLKADVIEGGPSYGP
jgi:hypothetical protein